MGSYRRPVICTGYLPLLLSLKQNRKKYSEMAPRQTMLIKGDDGEMIECEVLSTTEKESSFQKAVPVMNPSLASLFCFLNLIPGLGTFLATQLLLCGKSCSYSSNLKGYFVGILAAFLKFLPTWPYRPGRVRLHLHPF